MTTSTSGPTIILIAGHWLGAWAWDEVMEHLTGDGRRAVAMTLPGLDPADAGRASRTLADQVAEIERVAASAGHPVVLVAHSGANAPVSLVLDRHPDLVRRVVWVDSGPAAPGPAVATALPEGLTELPLPPFDLLGEQASLDGLDSEILARFRARAVPMPVTLLREPVVLVDERRWRVPTTVVCSSIPSAQMIDLARAGAPMFAEVARLELLDLKDLPTGHWPMWSRPADLAQLICAEADRDVA